MERHLNNKLVVITGGAEGIGYSISENFIQQGANVVILDLNEAKGTEAVNNLTIKYGNGKADFIKCDVTKDLEKVSKMIFDKYKTINVLVNNAGIVNENDIRKTLEINTLAVVEWSMKFCEHMRKDKGGIGGNIINIASIYGFAVDEFLAFYKTSKYAVMGFTKTLGHKNNYKRTGVRVVAVCPGFTYSTLTSAQLCWDEQKVDFEEYTNKKPWQTIDVVGAATIKVFKVADSGTAWKIEGGEPIVQVKNYEYL